MKISELKETVRTVIRERSINAIAKLQQKNIEDISKAIEFYKKNKHTDKKEAFIKVLKKLGNEKLKLAGELDLKVSGMYKDAEYKGEGIEEGENGLWDNIRKKKARGGKPAHKNSKAHKDAVKAGDKIKANESVVNERYSDFIKAKNLTDIIKLSKQKKNATFYVTDDNNSRIGTFYLKNGKFAKATTANANYDLQNSKTSLKNRNDVIYKYKVDESVNEGTLNESGYDQNTGLYYINEVPFTQDTIKALVQSFKGMKAPNLDKQFIVSSPSITIKDRVNGGSVVVDVVVLKELVGALKKFKLAKNGDFKNESINEGGNTRIRENEWPTEFNGQTIKKAMVKSNGPDLILQMKDGTMYTIKKVFSIIKWGK